MTIAILAGGESRRMGTDKARLKVDGDRLLEHVARAARPIAPTMIVGREDADGFDLPEVAFVPDEEPGQGPIGGLRTALKYAETPVVLLGCDMPRMTSDAIAWLVEQNARFAPDAGLVTTTGDRLQPLFAVYTPELLPTIEAMLADGSRSLHRLATRAGLPQVSVPEDHVDCLTNVNTPADLEQLHRNPHTE